MFIIPGCLLRASVRVSRVVVGNRMIDRIEQGPLYCFFALELRNEPACLESFRMRPQSWPA